MRSTSTLIAALAICGMCTSNAQAAPDEIQVYTEEMNVPGEFGLEQHLNYTLEGSKMPDFPGQMTSHHVLQATPEFSYGITETLEGGLYLPIAFTADGNSFINGLRLRLKYIAPRSAEDKLFYGLNVEVGYDSLRTSQSSVGMELRPIIGYRDEAWLVSFNPILNIALAADASHEPQFEPALKMTYRVVEEARAGLEYYGEFGSLNHLAPADQSAQTLFAVADVEVKAWDVNFGIGRGNVHAGDKWVVKCIIALPFK
ncbi:MAG: hypothetical protein PXX77_07255 [Gallionella sp.]|nr:hypothetical protein [Gallionella sp.]